MNRFVLCGVLAACLTISATATASPGKKAKPKEKTVTTKSGLKYIDLKVGKGPTPKPGQTLLVHYTGWLTDGKQFDSSKGKDPLPFVLGAHRVIKGWEEGMATMKVGGMRTLTIPPSLGYGQEGFPGAIPPNATLLFKVELVAIK